MVFFDSAGFQKWRNAGLLGIQSVQCLNEKNYRGRNQSVTELSWFCPPLFLFPVLNWNHGCRNTDAGVSFLDTDVQLWSYIYFVTHLLPLSSFPLSPYSSQTFILGSPHLFSLLLRCVCIHPRHISCDVHVSNVPPKNSRRKTNQKIKQENNLQDWSHSRIPLKIPVINEPNKNKNKKAKRTSHTEL